MTSGPSSAGDDRALRLEIGPDRVGHVVFDRPDSRVNLLSEAVLHRLDGQIGELESRIANGQLVALLLESAKQGSFIAGADVGEIGAVRTPEQARAASTEGQRIFRRLERLRVPTIACIDGTCLGGGTELSLHCNYRVASDGGSTKIGLPETRLGIIPGFGGCVKLPKVVGLQRALDIILSGKPVSGTRAGRIGLVDRVIPQHAWERGIREFVADVLAGRVPNVRARPVPPGETSRMESDRTEGSCSRSPASGCGARRTEGTRLPLRAIDVLEQTYGKRPDEAYPIEAEALGELIVGDVSRALVRVFGLSQEAKRALPEPVMATARDVRRGGRDRGRRDGRCDRGAGRRERHRHGTQGHRPGRAGLGSAARSRSSAQGGAGRRVLRRRRPGSSSRGSTDGLTTRASRRSISRSKR